MPITLANFSYALRTWYTPEFIMDTVSRDHPLLNMLLSKKKKKVAGDFISFPIQYSNGGGRSADFSVAQGNSGVGTKGVKLALQTVEDFAVVQWSGDVLESAENIGDGAFFEARQMEIDAKFRELGNSVGQAIYRSGSGSIGRVISTQVGASTTITLVNRRDAKNLQVGMKIVADSVDGGGTVGTTVSFVKSIDKANGTFTVSASDGGVAIDATTSDLTANQYIFAYGDYDAKLSGMQAWIPATVGGSDSFFGINRSVDRVGLAGWYLNKAGVPVDEAIYDSLVEITDNSAGNPKFVFINATDWGILAKSQSSRVIIQSGSDKAKYGFSAITIMGPRGPVEVIMDPDCPDKECYVIDLDSWHFIFKGKEPMFISAVDGLEVARIYNADGAECRLKGNFQLACSAPLFNARVILRT